MNKENKRMAQERRAKERKKQERINFIKKYIWIPITVALIALLTVVGIKSCISDQEAEATEAETTEEETTEAAVLNTDTSLVVAEGDTVNIDYIGYVGGVEFNGGNTEGEGADLEIGSDTYVDGFEDSLIGHNVGETFDITVTFPDNYGDTTTVNGDTVTLSNQEVVFTITINGIYE